MNGTYYTITEVFDFKVHISKIILDYGKSKDPTYLGAVYGTRYPYIHRGWRLLWQTTWVTNRMIPWTAHAASRTFTFLTKPVHVARTVPV